MYITRAQLLIEHARYADAEKELRAAVAAHSGDGFAHSLLALSLLLQKKVHDALNEAQIGRNLAPDSANSHFVLALVWNALERYDDARLAIQDAIRIDPEEPRHYGVLGSIHLNKREWSDALAAAEKGLRLDSQDVRLNNVRALALVKLGRRQEAGLTLGTTLARDPANATTHANQGWALLHRGEVEQAMIHFREALRLNPMLVWAKEGIVEALKARNPIYRVMLRYFLWMSRLSTRARWAVVLGFYVLSRVMRGLAVANPSLAPWLNPLLVLYSAFALLTWISRPLFNLLLRLNRFGRLALSRTQIVASNWIGGCILAAVLLFAVGLFSRDMSIVSKALVPLAMVVPISGLFETRRGKNRAWLVVYTVVLGAIGVAGMVFSPAGVAFDNTLLTLFLLGWMAYTWVANILIA